MSMSIPSYGGEGGHFFVMWLMKFKSYLAEKNLSEILMPTFKDSLPDTEAAILNENSEDDKKKIRALRLNAKGTRTLIMALKTPEMMNKIMLEQTRDVEWPNGISTNMWNAILDDEKPEDAIAEMKMEDDLRKIDLPRDNDPKKLLAKMAAIQVQYSCIMTESRKAAVVLRAGSTDFSVIMAMKASLVQAIFKRPATAAELVADMHKQYRIARNKTGKETDEETKEGTGDQHDDCMMIHTALADVHVILVLENGVIPNKLSCCC